MKKLWKSALTVMLSGALLGALYAATENEAASDGASAIERIDFDEFRAATFLRGKADGIKSGCIVYEAAGKDFPVSCLLLRGTADNQVRIDIITENEIFSICRNQDQYWGYSAGTGKVALSAEEAEEFQMDMPMLPLPFLKNSYYEPLLPSGAGMFRSSECIFFETHPSNYTPLNVTFGVDVKTQHLCLITAQYADVVYSTSFSQYRDFGGIELATRLTCSDPESVSMMKVKAVEWNVDFPASIFEMGGDLENDPALTEIRAVLKKHEPIRQRYVDNFKAEEQAKAEKELATAVQQETDVYKIQLRKRIAILEKEIHSLDQEIVAANRELQTVKSQANANLTGAQMAGTATPFLQSPFSYRHAWNSRSWGHARRHHRYARRGRRGTRRASRQMFDAAAYAAQRAQKLSSDLTLFRLQRNEAQEKMKKLQEELGVPVKEIPMPQLDKPGAQPAPKPDAQPAPEKK